MELGIGFTPELGLGCTTRRFYEKHKALWKRSMVGEKRRISNTIWLAVPVREHVDIAHDNKIAVQIENSGNVELQSNRNKAVA